MVGEASLLGLVPSVRYTVETRKGWCQTRGKTQSFGEQSVDCIPLGNGERGNLLMFFYFRIKFFCWRLSAPKKRERNTPQRRLKELLPVGQPKTERSQN